LTQIPLSDLAKNAARNPSALILGYSYRYWDDNVADDPSVRPRAYPSSAVRSDGEHAVAVATGREVKARWLKREGVRFAADGTPLHPTLDDLPLEEVIEKMSKSRGNVVSPDDVIAEFGADSIRLYELFMEPLEKGAPWATDRIAGCFRFLQRSYRLFVDEDAPGEPARALAEGPGTEEQQRLAGRTIAFVTADMEAIQPNTAISKLMVFSRDITKDAPLPRALGEAFLKLLSSFAPHLAEELWERLGHATPVALSGWPVAEPRWLVDEMLTLVVQVNGKRRAEVVVAKDADEASVRAAALSDENVRRHLEGKQPRKVIIVPGRLVNVVV
jgi:leucyl-tRNA synthetase